MAGPIRSLVPLADVRDMRASIAFYEKLGFSISNSVTADGEEAPSWCWLTSERAGLMLAKRAEWTSGDRLVDGVGTIVAAARTLPMMSERRVVTVLQAETILMPKRESDAAARALDQLEELLKSPEPQTTLVLVASTVGVKTRDQRIEAS